MKTQLVIIAAIAISAFAFQNCSKVEFQKMELASSVAPLCTELSPGVFDPKLKWDWYSQLDQTLPENSPLFSQVMASPTVGDLNGDKVPEIVFVSWQYGNGYSYSSAGVLRIVNGATGKTIKSVSEDALAPFATTTPLLIDIDGDGKAEIFYTHYLVKSIVALNHDGTRRWVQELEGEINMTNRRGFSAFDVDKDGVAEIIVGSMAFSENSSRQPVKKWQSEQSVAAAASFAVSLDPSRPDLVQMVTSNGVYDMEGKKVFSMPSASYAAANIDNVPGLELVGTGGGALRIVDGRTGALRLDKDLSVYNELQCPKGIGGGPGTLGDFDGNENTTEIAVATGRYLTIFDGLGNIVSKFATQDCSSLATGISSFDFNGDGKPEILYADEEYLRVFQLVNGQLEIVWSTINPSGTLNEYPVVADIDGNGSSELIVVSNNYAVGEFYADESEVGHRELATKITGLRVFEPKIANSWMPTRSLWNSFDYNPAFVTDQLRPVTNTSHSSFTSTLFRRNAQLGMFERKCASAN